MYSDIIISSAFSKVDKIYCVVPSPNDKIICILMIFILLVVIMTVLAGLGQLDDQKCQEDRKKMGISEFLLLWTQYKPLWSLWCVFMVILAEVQSSQMNGNIMSIWLWYLFEHVCFSFILCSIFSPPIQIFSASEQGINSKLNKYCWKGFMMHINAGIKATSLLETMHTHSAT